MWQKCPVCGGSGEVPNPYPTTDIDGLPCSVCGGMKIINDLTGRPPKHDGEMRPHDPTKIKLC